MENFSADLTDAQNELYGWIKNYLKDFQHSPSIRQMMRAMGLKSPAPIQSRLKHLQEKGYISWQEGKARTLQIVDALTVIGDSMIDACIADGDMVLMEPIKDYYSLRNGDIVSAMVPGLGTTLKYFFKRDGKIFLEAANPKYSPIILDQDQLSIQGKLVAVWRKSF